MFFGSYVDITGYVMLEYLQAYRFIPPKTSFQQVYGIQVSNGFLNVNVQNSKLTILLLFCNHPVQVHDLIFQSDGLYLHIFLCPKLSSYRGKDFKVMENYHHLYQSPSGVCMFYDKIN